MVLDGLLFVVCCLFYADLGLSYVYLYLVFDEGFMIEVLLEIGWTWVCGFVDYVECCLICYRLLVIRVDCGWLFVFVVFAFLIYCEVLFGREGLILLWITVVLRLVDCDVLTICVDSLMGGF